jgi:hypothetical protein
MDFPREEAPGAICRERKDDSSPVRRIAGLSKSKRQTQIICRAGLMEINERWKISLVGAELESASQPRVLFASARTLDKRIEGAAQPLLRCGTARILLLPHRIQIAPPCVAVTALSRERNLAAHNLEVPGRAQAAVAARQVCLFSEDTERAAGGEMALDVEGVLDSGVNG